jgi:hypothetical protein
MLRRKFAAITAGFTGEEKVRIARIMSAFGSETATKTFLELEGKRIFKLTPKALDANFNAAEAAHFKKQYLEARSSALGFTTKGKAFIRPGSYAQVAETAQHEFVHVLQQSYEKGYTSTIQYFMEHQAFWSSSASCKGRTPSSGTRSSRRHSRIRSGWRTRPTRSSPPRSRSGTVWRRRPTCRSAARRSTSSSRC